jgi:predicted phosphate transport protein (TIGR00153 family)
MGRAPPSSSPQPPAEPVRRATDPPVASLGCAEVARFSLLPRDRTFFDLFIEAGQNTLHASRLLDEMMHKWPEEEGISREILKAEQEGDRITHDIIRRLNSTFVTPIDREDIYGLATQMDDIVDFTEEAADFLGLYKIEAPMEQAGALTKVLVAACEQLAAALEHLRDFKDLEKYWIEIHRLENDGDRISRDAVASLFSNGIDPMVVIRWKDMFAVLENAIDATETAAQILEGIVIKNS